VFPRYRDTTRNYRCPHYLQGIRAEGCARQIAVSKLDSELWRKVSIILTNDSDFEEWIQTCIEELRRDESDAQSRIDRIQNELGRLASERQWVITQARKKTITDEDMEQQLKKTNSIAS
jgi:hypothetical protein